MAKRVKGLHENLGFQDLLNQKIFREVTSSKVLVEMRKESSIVIAGLDDNSYFYLEGNEIMAGSLGDKKKQQVLGFHKTAIKFLFIRNKYLFS